MIFGVTREVLSAIMCGLRFVNWVSLTRRGPPCVVISSNRMGTARRFRVSLQVVTGWVRQDRAIFFISLALLINSGVVAGEWREYLPIARVLYSLLL